MIINLGSVNSYKNRNYSRYGFCYSFFVLVSPPPSPLTWRVLMGTDISVFRWDYDHIYIIHSVVDEILSIFLCWKQAFFTCTKKRVGAEDRKNGLCQSGPPDPSSVLSHSTLSPEKLTYMNCPLYVLAVWFLIAFGKWKEVSRKLKEENKVRICIPLEPSGQVAMQVGCIFYPKPQLLADSPLPYSSLSWFRKLLSTLFTNRLPSILSFRASHYFFIGFLKLFPHLKKSQFLIKLFQMQYCKLTVL